MITLTARTHWAQTICDLRTGANLKGLTPAEAKIADAIWDRIPQYRSAAKKLAATGWYRVTHLDYTASLYRWTGSDLECVASHVSKHRVAQLRAHYEDYVDGKITSDVWTNYATGGYSTRRGLMADYSRQKYRIHAIAMSHADNLEEGKIGHLQRVAARN